MDHTSSRKLDRISTQAELAGTPAATCGYPAWHTTPTMTWPEKSRPEKGLSAKTCVHYEQEIHGMWWKQSSDKNYWVMKCFPEAGTPFGIFQTPKILYYYSPDNNNLFIICLEDWHEIGLQGLVPCVKNGQWESKIVYLLKQWADQNDRASTYLNPQRSNLCRST